MFRKISFAILVMVVMSSCEKELINPIPESILTNINSFNTSDGIESAVIGGYNVIQSMTSRNYEVMEMPSGTMFGELFSGTAGVNEIATLTVQPENPRINSFWKDCYRGVFRANTVLDNLDNPEDYLESEKDRFEGEAKFLRGYFYFDLVRIFGGVPLVTSILTTDEARVVGRDSEEKVYEQIVEDLKDAIDLLPMPSEVEWGRASKAAALALLAKVYVYLEDWPNAEGALEDLFSSQYSYELVDDFGSLFRVATEVNKEVILAVPYVEGTNGTFLAQGFAPLQGLYEVVNNGNSDNYGQPAWNFRKLFDNDDSRLPATIVDSSKAFSAGASDPMLFRPYFSKFISHSMSQDSGLDFPLLRLGDMILLYAEVLYNSNKENDALKQINRIRERAFGDNTHNYELSDISTKEDFYDKLLLERNLELALENNRWFDLVRTGRFTEELGDGFYGSYTNPTNGGTLSKININAKSYNRVFPIPLEQIQLAEEGVLEQNDGY